MKEEDCEEDDDGEEVQESTGVACLVGGFRGEWGEGVERDLPEIGEEEGKGEWEEGHPERRPPLPEEKRKEEPEEEQPVSFEEGVHEDGVETLAVPGKGEE